MRRPIVVSIVSLASFVSAIAAADAPPKPATAVPTRAVPCAPSNSELLAHDDDPVLCWANGCMALGLLDRTAALIKPKPAPQARWLTPLGQVRVEGGKPSVCVGTTCKPIGKQLAAAVEAARKDATPESPVTIEGTTDFKAVIVGDTPWSVAADKELKLKPPAKGLQAAGASVAGALIVANFTDCAGPCTQAQVFDSAGAAKSKVFAGAFPAIQVDAKRFAVLDEYGNLRVFAVGTGASMASTDTGGSEPDGAYVRIGASLAVLRKNMQGITIAQVAFDGPTPYKSSEMFLPACAE